MSSAQRGNDSPRFGAAIRGVGVYEPDEVRTNDFWPREIVERWQQKRKGLAGFSADAAEGKDYLEPIMREEINAVKGDPFLGFVRRRVAPAEMTPSEMEVCAAKAALDQAALTPRELDAVMTFSLPTDIEQLSTAFKVHHDLGATNAVAIGVSMLCCSINAMMETARQYIMSGTWRHALAVVSTKYSDVMDYTSSVSVLSGDGAGALVLSRCEDGRGILGTHLRSWTQFHDAMTGVRRNPEFMTMPRYDYGRTQGRQHRAYFSFGDDGGARRVLGALSQWAREAGHEIGRRTGYQPNDADILVTNAAHSRYSRIVARTMGVDLAKIEDNVSEYGNMGAVNLPMNMYQALQKKRISEGTKVLVFGHGGGASYGATLIDWVDRKDA